MRYTLIFRFTVVEVRYSQVEFISSKLMPEYFVSSRSNGF